MGEVDWHPLVAAALCAALTLDPVLLHAEVPFRDGSRADLVYVDRNRVVVFEVKLAESADLSAPLGARGLRQLRHFAAAADEVYVVTLAAPRAYDWTDDGQIRPHPTHEPQLLPPGIGWIVFDQLARTVTILRAAARCDVVPDDRRFLVESIGSRLTRAVRAVESCRL